MYTVTGTNSLGCIGIATSSVNVNLCTTIQNNLENQSQQITTYPNPTSASLAIQTDEVIETISIFNTLGALVQTEKSKTFSVEQLPCWNIYSLKLKLKME